MASITFKWLPPASGPTVTGYAVAVTASNVSTSPAVGYSTTLASTARDFTVTLAYPSNGTNDASITVAAVFDSQTGPTVAINGEVPCLAAGTLITMADGTRKPVEELLYSDKLRVWDFDTGSFAVAQPLWIKQKQTTDRYNRLVFSDGTVLRTIGNHRCLNKQAGAFTNFMTDETPVGTITVTDSGAEVTLVAQEVVEESVDYYNVITAQHCNLYADGILTSCRMNNLYPISGMQFQKVPRQLRDRADFAGIDDRLIDGLRLREQPLPLEELIPYCQRLQELGRHWDYLFRWQNRRQPNLDGATMRGIVTRYGDRGWVLVARSGSNSMLSMLPLTKHFYLLQDVGLPAFPVCVMVRDPVERFRSSCAYMQRTPEEALASMTDEFHFWSLEQMGLIRSDITYFRFPDQFTAAIAWLGLEGAVPTVNPVPDEIKPVLTADQEAAVRAAYAADVALWESLNQ